MENPGIVPVPLACEAGALPFELIPAIRVSNQICGCSYRDIQAKSKPGSSAYSPNYNVVIVTD